MSVPAARIEPVPAERLRLLAVGLCAWHDADPVACSKVRGESGKQQPGVVLSRRDRDSLLLKLEKQLDEQEPELGGEPDDRTVVDLIAYQRHRAHPFWRRLEAAMDTLAVADPWQHRLIYHVYVAAGDPRRALLRAHALRYLTDGRPGVPVAAPRADLVEAMLELDRLVGDVRYPASLLEQVEGWEQWVTAARAVLGLVGAPKEGSKNARRQLREFVREVLQLDFSQAEVARKFGLDRKYVSKVAAEVAE